ncbi:hypothetical protein IQ07DRAFT_592708 [Pyrenochaeta sp. DS3sAY3a]|nr:hypothetical protein IQ07DRAFT_592708 [Pyrenochaeta sp. DS3sAY3a]
MEICTAHTNANANAAGRKVHKFTTLSKHATIKPSICIASRKSRNRNELHLIKNPVSKSKCRKTSKQQHRCTASRHNSTQERTLIS